LVIFSEKIIQIITTTEFHKAWIYIPILAIAPLFQSVSSFSGTNFTASKKTKYIFYASILGGISSLVLNLLLIPKFGVWGAVIAIVLSHLCMAIARVYFSWKYVKINNLFINLSNLSAPILISLILVLIHDFLIRYAIIIVLTCTMILINRLHILELAKNIRKNYGNLKRRN
jgi:O-antigen/teichoic acid export membrane protein